MVKKQAEDFVKTDFYEAQKKQLFAETLKYIKSLEKLSEVKREGFARDFLHNRINSLSKKYPKSQAKREDTIKILSDDRLRKGYNEHVTLGTALPMISYEECKKLCDEMDQQKSKWEDQDKVKENLNKVDGPQDSYIKEKEQHPFEGSACQKMTELNCSHINTKTEITKL
ncbi:hypothetical protein [Wolbachia endosymbiont of Ctenocephalides felis wCfeT]|uniref:hypothetical protein n=1 Tax=Wolbachia endosymbiont of Ctenocephalides felis wCfeT TaxID=2732593 RepID=UPI0014453C08|nr:hypothetical protein [Wolbachia endosymbiont of Ctenocephalides felis wCfeT]